MREITINGHRTDDETVPYVIAELGHNHQGDIKTAEKMIRAAAYAGASAVKLQKRDNKTLFTKAYYDQPYNSENAYGATYGEHREALEFDQKQYALLRSIAHMEGIDFFATAFDLPSVDFLVNFIGVPAIKIASADLTNLPLIEYAASADLPLIISTGGSTSHHVWEAFEAAGKRADVVFMQCTAVYPAPADTLNLSVIPRLRNLFPHNVIGYSGHDVGIVMPVIAWSLGARVIEKHFTLNRTMKGSDQAWSLEPEGMRKMVRDLDRARVAMGSDDKVILDAEQTALAKMGKIAVAARALPDGHLITEKDVLIRSAGVYRAGVVVPSQVHSILIGSTIMKAMAEEEPFDTNELLPF